MQSAVLVANSSARQTTEALARARAMLAERDVRITHTHVVDSHKELCRYVRRAVENRVELVIVGGGDGTMTSAVGHLAKSKTIMGVLPLGTGNSFALSLGITNLEVAVEAIVAGRKVSVDLGRVNGTYFANFATIGLSSTIARATPNRLKKIVGAAAYVLAGLLPGLRSRPFRCKVNADEETIAFNTFQVIVANGRYFGHTPLTPEASLKSGHLTLYSTSDTTIVDAAKTYASLLLDRQGLLANAHIMDAKEILVRTRPAQLIAIDGEQLGRKRKNHFKVVPDALRVMVPAVTPPEVL